jgi:dolichyl-phosphate-mannose-protein mannosyltransferase
MGTESSTVKASFRSIEHPLAPTLLIVGVGALLLVALRRGQPWDGDFALYLMNARNIVLGLPYAKTAYLLNPDNAINPAAYPPGLPLLFAPIYALFGIDLLKLKILCIGGLLLFLVVFYRIARGMVPASFALAVTGLIGLHPFIVDSENSPASEFPFLFFCYLALYLLHRTHEQDRTGGPWSLELEAATSLAVAFAYLTRSVGVLIFPAAFAISVLNTRRLLTRNNAALAGAAVLVLLAQAAFPADLGTYVHYFDNYSLHGVWATVVRYWGVYTTLVGQVARIHPSLGAMLGVGIFVLATIGFVARVRRGPTVYEAFFGMYACFLIIYPITIEVSRYSLPIWPLLFLYCAYAIDLCRRQLAGPIRYALPLAALVIFATLYAVQYASMSFGEIPFSVEASPSQDLFAFLRNQLPDEARVLTRKPTIVGAYTGHEASTWPEQFTDTELWSFLKDRHIEYIVQDVTPLGVRATSVDALAPFIERNSAQLDPVFQNEWFNVYKTVR